MKKDKKPREPREPCEFEVLAANARKIGSEIPKYKECPPDHLRLIDKESFEWLLANHLHLKAFLYNLINDKDGRIVSAQQFSPVELAQAKAKNQYLGLGVYGVVFIPSSESKK